MQSYSKEVQLYGRPTTFDVFNDIKPMKSDTQIQWYKKKKSLLREDSSMTPFQYTLWYSGVGFCINALPLSVLYTPDDDGETGVTSTSIWTNEN